MPKFNGYENTLKLTCRPLAFTSHKAFLKNKKRSGTKLVSLSFFFMVLYTTLRTEILGAEIFAILAINRKYKFRETYKTLNNRENLFRKI